MRGSSPPFALSDNNARAGLVCKGWRLSLRAMRRRLLGPRKVGWSDEASVDGGRAPRVPRSSASLRCAGVPRAHGVFSRALDPPPKDRIRLEPPPRPLPPVSSYASQRLCFEAAPVFAGEARRTCVFAQACLVRGRSSPLSGFSTPVCVLVELKIPVQSNPQMKPSPTHG